MRLFAFVIAMFMAGGAGAATLAGLAYSPSGVATFDQLAKGISEARIRADLEQLKPLTDEVRIYSVDHGLDRVVPIAASLGMKVTIGIYLGRDQVQNAAEMNHAISVVKNNRKAISRIIVGNETVQHGDRSVDDIVQAMDEVRRGIGSTAIPVGTAEIWSVWLREPRLAEAAAFIGAQIIPYWDGVGVDEASVYVLQRVDELRKAYPGKPVVISETGWPSSGPVREGAVPSPSNQAQFAAAFATGGAARSHTYFLVEAYDQPWKAASEGDFPFWGLFDLQRHAKPVVDALGNAAARRE